MEQGKAQVKSDCDRLGKELSSKNKEVSEMHRTCQQLIQDREEWRGKEVALQRKLEAMHLRLREHEADGKEMHEAAARLQKTITGQDAQLQETLAAKQQLVHKLEQTIAAQGHELACVREQTAGLVPKPSPPAEDLDEQSQRLIAAESVASFGINEARAIKVECQQLKRKLTRVEASNTRANEACAAYKSGCETLQEEIEHLAQEVSSARHEHQSDRTQLLAQLRASEQRERDLHASMHAFRGRDVSVEEARQEVERLGSRDIEVLRTENHALKEEARELREASLGIREEIEEYQKRYLALMKTLQQVREQSDDHRRLASEDIQALNHENAEIFEDYSRVREERQQLRAQLTDAEKHLSDLREEKLSRRSDSLPGTAAAAAAAGDPNAAAAAAAAAMAAAAMDASAESTKQQKSRELQLESELSVQASLVKSLNLKISSMGAELLRCRGGLQAEGGATPAASAGGGGLGSPSSSSLTRMLEQENERLREEIRGLRRSEAGGGDADGVAVLVARLEADKAALVAELDARRAVQGHEQQQPQRHPPPPSLRTGSLSPGSPHSAAQPGTPLTKLQALASQGMPPPPPSHPMHPSLLAAVGGGADGGGGGAAAAAAVHGSGVVDPNPELEMHVAELQKTLHMWNSCLQKLVQKLGVTLKNASHMRGYLLDHAPSGGAAGARGEGLPIVKQDKYPTEGWNKAFEAVSGLRFCLTESEQGATGIVAQSVVLQTKLRGLLQQQQQPPSDGALASALQRPTSTGPPPSSAMPGEAAELLPLHALQHAQLQMEREQQVREHHGHHAAAQDSLAGAYQLMDHAADTDSEASSNPGEDMEHCTALIYDTDTLLRATQGTDLFWGDSRIEYLKTELKRLQQDPVPQQPGATPEGAAAAAAAAGAGAVQTQRALSPEDASTPGRDPPQQAAQPRYHSTSKTMRWG